MKKREDLAGRLHQIRLAMYMELTEEPGGDGAFARSGVLAECRVPT